MRLILSGVFLLLFSPLLLFAKQNAWPADSLANLLQLADSLYVQGKLYSAELYYEQLLEAANQSGDVPNQVAPRLGRAQL
ncbi:MAG TPA: hypothetical protein DCE41_02610, partial [Cytophagales bacterium]|nr:hypothetical protein [Cytophagales bacterium]